MRAPKLKLIVSGLAAAAVLVFASAAAAESVRIAPVSISQRLHQKLEDDYGLREGPVLQDYVVETVRHALERAGAQVTTDPDAHAQLTLEVELVDAATTRPTFAEMEHNLGLSYFDSISVGGAKLNAVLRGAEGNVIAEIKHDRFAWGLDDASLAGGTWGDARRSIRVFASKVARAYRASQPAPATQGS